MAEILRVHGESVEIPAGLSDEKRAAFCEAFVAERHAAYLAANPPAPADAPADVPADVPATPFTDEED